MILLIHKEGRKVVEVFRQNVPISYDGKNCIEVLWHLAELYPDELLVWCEVKLKEKIAAEEEFLNVFHHENIMASYSINSDYLPDSIGYVDQFPFVNVNRAVLYGTWRMSWDIGGIKGKILLLFRDLMRHIDNLGFLLNSISKVGQQNGLFCYSAPQLYRGDTVSTPLEYKASKKELFKFVYSHYKTPWTTVLLFSFILFEKKLPVLEFFYGFFEKKLFQKIIDLSTDRVSSSKGEPVDFNIDVIIPTFGRKKYLLDVLQDFSKQTIIPLKIIIVEQDPNEFSSSQLNYIQDKKWPFQIIHHFIHKTGACNARNLALNNTTADWVFFSDDDQRFDDNLIEKISQGIKKYGLDCLTTSYLQLNEKKFFKVPKQWGTFGAGNSVVRGEFARRVKFSAVFEHGYGEDADYGRQLKNVGCDIVYLPDIEIKHLKAPAGGFRNKPKLDWDNNVISPKPSPTVMAHALKHYSKQQIRGFKFSLFLRFYKMHSTKNPVSYIKQMNSRWLESNKIAQKLLQLEE